MSLTGIMQAGQPFFFFLFCLSILPLRDSQYTIDDYGAVASPQHKLPGLTDLKMLVCRACAKRTAANLLRRLPATENVLVRPPRTFATSSTRQFEWDDVQSEHVGAGGSSRDAVPQGRKDVSKEKNDQKLKWAVKKELQRTTDPFHIADRVSQMLKSQEFDKALMVTREASKDKQVVVSWNHLIEYQFNARSLHAGIKLYNEVSFLSCFLLCPPRHAPSPLPLLQVLAADMLRHR